MKVAKLPKFYKSLADFFNLLINLYYYYCYYYFYYQNFYYTNFFHIQKYLKIHQLNITTKEYKKYHNKYQKLSEEKKEKKQQHGNERYKNLFENEKRKLVE